jgi:alpha-beta hydrolase superfamily lysophospholipase
MKKTDFTFKTKDHQNIFVYKWSPENKAVGVVQIAHGMAEHADRYQQFAEYLTSKGFIVYANDHLGHGKTAGSLDKVGFFAEKNGWHLVADDLKQLTDIIAMQNPALPIFLLGHSMGSLLIRTYLTKYSDPINGVILSGTSGESGFMVKMGKMLSKLLANIKGKKAPCKTLDQLSFGKFNQTFKPNRTKFDWLSRDDDEVDKYVKDPYCGAVFTTQFFNDMLSGVDYNNQPENIAKIDKNIPVYFIAGDMDPVGEYGKGVKRVFNAYQKAGIKDIEIKRLS